MATNYNLQVKSLVTGATFPIQDVYQDSFTTEDEAVLQASTLSKLAALRIRVWGGSSTIRQAAEAFTIVVVQVRGWFVIDEYKEGVPV